MRIAPSVPGSSFERDRQASTDASLPLWSSRQVCLYAWCERNLYIILIVWWDVWRLFARSCEAYRRYSVPVRHIPTHLLLYHAQTHYHWHCYAFAQRMNERVMFAGVPLQEAQLVELVPLLYVIITWSTCNLCIQRRPQGGCSSRYASNMCFRGARGRLIDTWRVAHTFAQIYLKIK